jgi:hypothetical protein
MSPHGYPLSLLRRWSALRSLRGELILCKVDEIGALVGGNADDIPKGTNLAPTKRR